MAKAAKSPNFWSGIFVPASCAAPQGSAWESWGAWFQHSTAWSRDLRTSTSKTQLNLEIPWTCKEHVSRETIAKEKLSSAEGVLRSRGRHVFLSCSSFAAPDFEPSAMHSPQVSQCTSLKCHNSGAATLEQVPELVPLCSENIFGEIHG